MTAEEHRLVRTLSAGLPALQEALHEAVRCVQGGPGAPSGREVAEALKEAQALLDELEGLSLLGAVLRR